MPLDIFFLCILLLLFVGFLFFYFKGNIGLKLVVISFIALISIYSVYSVIQWRGYALDSAPTKRVRLASIVVIPKDYRSPGGIYLYAYESETELRNYRLPYTEDSGDKFQNHKKKLESGYILVYNPDKMGTDGDVEGDGDNRSTITGKGVSKPEGQRDTDKANYDQAIETYDPADSYLKKED